jgi:hypothetical protein
VKQNSKKDKFINSFSVIQIEDHKDLLKNNIKFNFKYFDNTQSVGQDFKDWTHEQLSKLFDKLKEYSRESIKHWTTQKVGKKRNSILAIYKNFPSDSKFKHPKHVPFDVWWARFHLEWDMRLIGFIIPDDDDNQLDKSVFYIVFLDKDHNFYS